jgi:prepilin-type N-terminal cleavage/methylation domain-containing protein
VKTTINNYAGRRVAGTSQCFGVYAFTLVEVIVCMAIIGIAFASLYAGIGSGFNVINNSRENLRANQVLLEKLETLRLYTWDEVNSNGFINPTFTAPFFPSVITNLTGTNADGTLRYTAYTNNNPGNLVFFGTVNLDNAAVSPAYATNMRLVTVTLNWTNKNISHQRQMQTLITANGLQDYIFF